MPQIQLPYGTRVTVENGCATIASNLRNEVPIRSADALESFMMAMAFEGIDMADPRISRALNSAVDGIQGHEYV
jgi:IMP cyclohydrolase